MHYHYVIYMIGIQVTLGAQVQHWSWPDARTLMLELHTLDTAMSP